MTILFEAFVRDEKLVERIPGPGWVILAELKRYVEGRLMPLKDEIDKEEEEKPDDALCTFIHFPSGLRFCGYSENLIGKMTASFDNSERDVQVIWLKIDEMLRDILDGDNRN